ncbi:MAG: class I SAM-dependent methyltransferase [Vicinamibacterales bacterium]
MNHRTSFPHRMVAGAVIAVLAGASVCFAADEKPSDRSDIARRLQTALAAGDLEIGAELAEQVSFAELVEYLDARYELLRIHCLRKDETKALETLQTMLDAGYWDYRRLKQDPDIAWISSTEEFQGRVRAAWTKQYISMLERDTRDAMQHPARIMELLAIEPGTVVADVGAGSGYFTIPLARAVGPQGKVIATDIRQEMLDHIAARLHEEELANVTLLKVEPTEPGLPAGTIDTVLMVDVIHYVKDRAGYARKLKPALAPGGRVVVIDFRYDPEAKREFAPPPEQQVPRETLDREMAESGFVVAESYDFLPEQYFVVYRAAE